MAPVPGLRAWLAPVGAAFMTGTRMVVRPSYPHAIVDIVPKELEVAKIRPAQGLNRASDPDPVPDPDPDPDLGNNSRYSYRGWNL